MNIAVIKTDSYDGKAQVLALRRTLEAGGLAADGESPDIPGIVRRIIADVEAGRDKAAAEITSRLDDAEVTPETIRAAEADILAAHQAAEPGFLELVRKVAANIR